MIKPNRYYTQNQSAKFLNISPVWLNHLAKKGEIEYIQFGQPTLYLGQHLIDWLNSTKYDKRN